MSATITIEFEDGRKVQWVTSRQRGEMTWIDLNFNVGDCYKAFEPLEFKPFKEMKGCLIAETGEYSYIILNDTIKDEIKLYQMPADEPLCPVNSKRANSFRRFSVECGDSEPIILAAIITARDWNKAASGF